MSFGVLMLVHTALDRVAQVARHYAEHGYPVVIHADAIVGQEDFARLEARLDDLENVIFSARHRCEWGRWGLVAASLDAARAMLTQFPGVQNVMLTSGSCLPLRPLAELRGYLEERPDVDFIESVTTDDVDWTVGGLAHERFTLGFPFSWRTQRRLFDRYVRLQRQFGRKRRIPDPITPHLGSQWWCLTRETLSKIMDDPRRAEFDSYFKKVWIPDESYFQSLARLHSRVLESRSLTLNKFDFQGKPYVFYDDHIQLLERSECFMARKIWSRAERVYSHFLRESRREPDMVEPQPLKIERLFDMATHRRTRGRPGLVMPSRFPRYGSEADQTSGRYSVFSGFTDLFDGYEQWLHRRTGHRVHGHLYAPDKVHFADDDETFVGCLPSDGNWRNYRPNSLLINLLWNTRGEHQCFQFGPEDDQRIANFMVFDRNATIFLVTGTWALPLLRSGRPFEQVRKDAARLQKTEQAFLDGLRSGHARARVRIWTFSEFIERPTDHLQSILAELGWGQNRGLNMPTMADRRGLATFLRKLKNDGMHPYIMGDIATKAFQDVTS